VIFWKLSELMEKEYGVDGSTTVQRKAKGHVEKIICTSPELFKYYNEKMEGVD
jgi:hypothetical protein